MDHSRRQSDRRPSDRPPPAGESTGPLLFVDDEPAVCRAFQRTVQRHGYDVVTTTSGEAAIDLCQRRVFSTVVTDLMMPGLNGFQLIERLSASQPELAFVAVTGMQNLDMRRESFEQASLLGVVKKPWDERELLDVLKRSFEVNQRRRHSALHTSRPLPRVLLIEDDPNDAFLVKRALRGHSSEVVTAGSMRHAERIAEERSFDAVLVDLSLPDARGLDAVVRMRRLVPQAAILVLSGDDDTMTARHAIRAGAHDYLVKGIDSAQLVRAMSLATERARFTGRLRSMAHRDALTGLANRRTLHDQVSRARALSESIGGFMALLYVDLDRFKSVNDTLGHEAGDALLQEVSRRLLQATRDIDTVARLGGDEFAVLLPQLKSRQVATVVGQRVLDAMRAPFLLPGATVTVTCSVGVVSVCADEPHELDGLLRQADTAMYDAKRRGRNLLGHPTENVASAGIDRIGMENELRRAVAEKRFELAFQPQYRAAGDLHGFEMLMRWSREDGRTVGPSEFIPMLEDLGLIAEVGRWAVRQSCLCLARWQRNGLDPSVVMAVNVSSQEFETVGLLASVRRAIEETGIEPSSLELEITEGILMQDTQRTNQTLEGLHKLGVQLAIDDFGTGHSSLAYLQRFRVNRLKVDKCFVSGDAVGDYSIVEAVIALGHRLGIEVVAEGVEDHKQRDVLVAAGCDVLQGYFLGRPGPGWPSMAMAA